MPGTLTMKRAAGLTDGRGGRTDRRRCCRNGISREWVTVDVVTANFFDALGVRPVAGARLFGEQDDAGGRGPVAVLSDRFWRQRFARDPAIVGQTFRLGQSLTYHRRRRGRGIRRHEYRVRPGSVDSTHARAAGRGQPADARHGRVAGWGCSAFSTLRDSLETARANLQGHWLQSAAVQVTSRFDGSREALVSAWIPPGA